MLYWYKRTNTDAESAPRRQVAAGEGGVVVGEGKKEQVAVDDACLIALAGISVRGLQLLVYKALSYNCMRP